MDLAIRDQIIFFTVLALGVSIAVFIACWRANWKVFVLLAVAGVFSGVLSVAERFEPIGQAILPFRYEPFNFVGGSMRMVPHDAPPVVVWIARHGRLLPRSQQFAPGQIYDIPKPLVGWYPSPVSIDPNAVCALPISIGSAAPAETPEDQLITYRGWRAFLFYAFGNSSANSILHGGLRALYHGIVLALVLLVWRRTANAFNSADRAWVLIVSAWLSVLWPALAVYSWHFFSAVQSAWFRDGSVHNGGRLPLALGYDGYRAIWLGAIVAHIGTITAVARWRLRKQAPMADSDSSQEGAPPQRRLLRRGLACAKWALIAGLFAAPLTLPLIGAITPMPVLRQIGALSDMLPPAPQPLDFGPEPDSPPRGMD